MSAGWRVWFAFEVRPGVTSTSMQDRSALWRALSKACRRADGSLDQPEFEHWLTYLVDHSHLWGQA